MQSRNYAKDMLLGVTVADALWGPDEFVYKSRMHESPVTDLREFENHHQSKGTWSEDSSLTFCTAESLLKGYNLLDMAHRFVRWNDQAEWTPYGTPNYKRFKTLESIKKLKNILETERIEELSKLRSEYDNNDIGTGAVMRILPLICYIKDKPIKEQFEIIWDVSALTEYHFRSGIACLIYLKFAEYLIDGNTKEYSFRKMQKDITSFLKLKKTSDREQYLFSEILRTDLSSLPEKKFSWSNFSYLTDNLEACLWCVMNNETYSDTVLSAVNLGGCSTAASTGGLAGLIYSFEHIPSAWIDTIAQKESILELADKLQDVYF